jgi:glucokinase
MRRIGIEIGGSKLQAALGDGEGRIVSLRKHDVPRGAGAPAILEWCESVVPELIAEGGAVESVGVGFGGPVDTAAGTAVRSHQVSGWDGVSIRNRFAEKFGVPVSVWNDSNAAGWAEYICGAGRGTNPFCYMNVGSGIGGAIVIDGRLHNGQGLGAAEIGHTYVPDPFATTPGQPVKLEDRCSGWSIERYLRIDAPIPDSSKLLRAANGDREQLTCALLGQCAAAGDETAVFILDGVARSIAIALANVLALVHPECIAVGGGVGFLGDTLLAPIRRHLAALVFEPYRGRYRIVPCELGEQVVVTGALLLADPAAQLE